MNRSSIAWGLGWACGAVMVYVLTQFGMTVESSVLGAAAGGMMTILLGGDE